MRKLHSALLSHTVFLEAYLHVTRLLAVVLDLSPEPLRGLLGHQSTSYILNGGPRLAAYVSCPMFDLTAMTPSTYLAPNSFCSVQLRLASFNSASPTKTGGTVARIRRDQDRQARLLSVTGYLLKSTRRMGTSGPFVGARFGIEANLKQARRTCATSKRRHLVSRLAVNFAQSPSTSSRPAALTSERPFLPSSSASPANERSQWPFSRYQTESAASFLLLGSERSSGRGRCIFLPATYWPLEFRREH